MLFKVRADNGSAVVDFVLVLVPTSLLAFPLLSIISMMHSSLVSQEVAFDIARFSALADVSVSEREQYRKSRDENMKVQLNSTIDGCFMTVQTTKSYNLILWPEPIEISTTASAQCEKG